VEEDDLESRVAELIERGLQLFGGGDLLGALSHWKHALALDEDSMRARDFIAYVRRHFAIADDVAGGGAFADSAVELDVPFGLATVGPLSEAGVDAYESFELVATAAPRHEDECDFDEKVPTRVSSISEAVDEGWSLDSHTGELIAPRVSSPAELDDGPAVGFREEATAEVDDLEQQLAAVAEGLEIAESGATPLPRPERRPTTEPRPTSFGYQPPRPPGPASNHGGVEIAGPDSLEIPTLESLELDDDDGDDESLELEIELGSGEDGETVELDAGDPGSNPELEIDPSLYEPLELDGEPLGSAPLEIEADEPGSMTLEIEADEPGPMTLEMEADEPGPMTLEMEADEPGPMTLEIEADEPDPVTLEIEADEPDPVTLEIEADPGDIGGFELGGAFELGEPSAPAGRPMSLEDDGAGSPGELDLELDLGKAGATSGSRLDPGTGSPAVGEQLEREPPKRGSKPFGSGPEVGITFRDPSASAARKPAGIEDELLELEREIGGEGGVEWQTHRGVAGSQPALKPLPPPERKPSRGTKRTAAPAVPEDLAALCRRIVTEIDAGVPESEPADDRRRRRITALLDRAEGESDLAAAAAAADLALAEDPDSAVAQKLVHQRGEVLSEVFRGYLGDLAGIPAVALPMHEISLQDLDHRTAFLLSRIDGILSFEDILDVSGMPRLEALRYLCRLRLQGILEVR
jgi:hypothetical protein